MNKFRIFNVFQKKDILLLFIILSTPWFWIMLQRNFLVCLLAVILTFLAANFFWCNKSRKLIILIMILNILLFLIAIREAFDENIFRNSALDIQQYNRRHELLAQGLGKLYKNKFSLFIYKNYSFPLAKLQSNYFANLDPNLYFFASHPRERLGVEEFNKFFPIFLPFFLIGLFYCIYIKKGKVLIYFLIISLVSMVVSPKYNLGPILFFPLISFMITAGIMASLQKGLSILKRRNEN